MMRKQTVPVLCLLALTAAVWNSSSAPAQAIPAFWDEFAKMYVKAEDDAEATEEQKEFAKLAVEKKTGQCRVCHTDGKPKKRNIYGKALDELLDKKEVSDLKKKDAEAASKMIQEALAKVAALPANPDDEKSPKFGDLIESGKFPASLVQEEEPKEEEKDVEGDK